MNEIHFKSLDLNLLRVFEALLAEGNATRAGQRLGLTQSAVSHSLSRLRLALNDELFVRGPSGLQATPRAMELGGAVREAMKLLEAAVSPPVFDPATTDRRFDIAAGPYTGAVLMPALVGRLLKTAPGIRLRVRNIEAPVTAALDRADIDMVIAGFEHVPERFAYRPLFSEQGAWVVRSGHPAARPGMTVEDIVGLPHLLVSPGQPIRDQRPDQRNLHLLRISAWSEDYALGSTSISDFDGPVTVADSYSALSIVVQTDMAALLPRRFAQTAVEKGRVVVVEPATPPRAFEIGAVVRQGEQETGPVAWLLDLVAETARTI